MRHYRIQLHDAVNREAIITSGGKAYVAGAGEEAKVTLYNEDGSSLTNPISLTYGAIEFWTADAIPMVDLYIQAPSGHFLVAKTIYPSGPNTLYVDKSRSNTTYVIPFSSADTSDATETDTGFDLPTNGAVLPMGIGVDVTNAASTETIDVGILASESGGDANGFIALGALTTAASIIAGNVVTVGSNESYLASTTLGALVHDFAVGTDVNEDTGQSSPKAYVCNGTAKSISYTLTTGTAALVGEGFIKLPVQLPIASL